MEQQLQLDLMEQRLDGIEHKVISIDTKVDAITKNVDKVMSSLVGNDLTKNKGWIDDLIALKQDVQDMKDHAKKQRFIVAVIVSGGLLLQFIIDIYTKLKP